jgi:hypothetical protein
LEAFLDGDLDVIPSSIALDTMFGRPAFVLENEKIK